MNQKLASDETPWSPGEKPGVYAKRVLLLLGVALLVLWGASYIEGLIPASPHGPETSPAEARRRFRENVQRNVVESLRVAGFQFPENATVRLSHPSGRRSNRAPPYRSITIDFHTDEYLNLHEYKLHFQPVKSENKYKFERWVLVHHVTGKTDLIEVFQPPPSAPLVTLRGDPRSYMSRERWQDAGSIGRDRRQARSRRTSESRVFQAAIKRIFPRRLAHRASARGDVPRRATVSFSRQDQRSLAFLKSAVKLR